MMSIRRIAILIILLILFLTPDGNAITGLDFPGSGGVIKTMRFKFTNPHLNGLPIYGTGGAGVTYIWRVYPRHQDGYYTTFFWMNDDGTGTLCPCYSWVGNCQGVNTYYGAHPYPDWKGGSLWEIAAESNDYTGGAVVPNRWYIQALRVWADGSGKHHVFYWDLPNTDAGHIISHTASTSYGETNPPFPALTWGDCPCDQGQEVFYGIIRGIQIYSSLLSISDIISEVATPLSTVAGAANIWYLNVNPTPTDISDKSGKGHNPSWVGSERPTLYSVDDTRPVPVQGLKILGSF